MLPHPSVSLTPMPVPLGAWGPNTPTAAAGRGLKSMATPPPPDRRPEAPNPTLHPPPHRSASEPLPRAGVWPGQEPREGQCLSENPVCAQQLNACPAQSPPFMGGMEGWAAHLGMCWRPRKMAGSPCRPGAPSQLSPAPTSHSDGCFPPGAKFPFRCPPSTGPSPGRLSPSSLTRAPSVRSPPASLARNALPPIRLKHTPYLWHRFIALIYCCFSAATKRMRGPPPLSLSISSLPGNNC